MIKIYGNLCRKIIVIVLCANYVCILSSCSEEKFMYHKCGMYHEELGKSVVSSVNTIFGSYDSIVEKKVPIGLRDSMRLYRKTFTLDIIISKSDIMIEAYYTDRIRYIVECTDIHPSLQWLVNHSNLNSIYSSRKLLEEWAIQHSAGSPLTFTNTAIMTGMHPDSIYRSWKYPYMGLYSDLGINALDGPVRVYYDSVQFYYNWSPHVTFFTNEKSIKTRAKFNLIAEYLFNSHFQNMISESVYFKEATDNYFLKPKVDLIKRRIQRAKADEKFTYPLYEFEKDLRELLAMGVNAGIDSTYIHKILNYQGESNISGKLISYYGSVEEFIRQWIIVNGGLFILSVFVIFITFVYDFPASPIKVFSSLYFILISSNSWIFLTKLPPNVGLEEYIYPLSFGVAIGIMIITIGHVLFDISYKEIKTQ